MKKIILILFFWLTISCAQQVDHTIFTTILQHYNHNGRVDYEGLTTENKLDEYLNNLSISDPNKLKSDESKMAFWINAYNAFTIKAIVDNYPIESINDLHTGGKIIGHIFSTTVWDEEFINISGKEYSLNDIEHKILRKKFDDNRIHFAIVCASISCPILRNEAYTAAQLENQLQDQAMIFFNDETKNVFDVKNKVAHLSKILDWFSEDFGENDEELLLFVSQFLDKTISEDIKINLDEWDIDYLDYDWGLNDYKTN